MKTVACCFFAIGLSASAFGQEPATGKFTSQSISFAVNGGVAFKGVSSFNTEQPALIVAVSNDKLSQSLSDYVDRKRALSVLVADERTAVVYFEFTPEGKYRGLSYYLGSGNGCGFCTSEVKSGVKLANGRLTGTLKGTEKGRPFEIALNVAVMDDDHGAVLPPDGGAPGKAFMAYHAALVKRNANALRPTLSADQMEVWDRAKKNNELPGYLAYLMDKHLMTTVKITKAWAKEDVAALLVEGDGPAGSVSGEILLLREKGAWVVDSEAVVK